MKRLRILSVVIAVCVAFSWIAANPAAAQSLDGKKVGYVNLSRLFDEYKKTQAYDKVLEKEHGQYEQERNQKLEKIRETQSKLALMKEEEKVKLQSQIDKMRAELLGFDREQQMELRKKRDDKLREILLEVEKVVREFAEKNNFAIILNDRVLIYGGDTYDITEQILDILNKNYKQ